MRMTTLISMMLLAFTWTSAAHAGGAEVARAQFTTAVEDREPVDDVRQLGTEQDSVSFFTELRNLEGRTVTHRWVFDRATVATVEFEVGGPRWRVWSTKDLVPDRTGTWTVLVVDDAGRLHGSWSFEYGEAAE